MNTYVKIFCLVWCIGMLPSFYVWAEELDAKAPAASTEPAGQEALQGPPPQTVPPQPERPVRDPFESGLNPVETPAAPSPDQPVEIKTVLEGISIGARGSRVVINGEVYKEGEDKKGIKIIQIRKKEVDILINQSIKRTLSMLPGETRETPVATEEAGPPPVLGEGETADTLTVEGQAENKEPTYA